MGTDARSRKRQARERSGMDDREDQRLEEAGKQGVARLRVADRKIWM
jgi:hypothetical protein